MTLLVIGTGVLGLLIGSFLNVVIYRVPREESLLFPASHCPSCEKELKPWHNVPVLSWVLLRGRCGFCRVPISGRYPLVEAGTAVLYMGLAMRFGLSVELVAYLYVGSVGITLAMIGIDGQRLPDSIILPSFVVTVILLMPAGAAQHDFGAAQRALLAMIALAVIHLALAYAYPTSMAFGEAKLAALVGIYLGWASWGAVLIGAFGALLFAAFGGAALLATRRTRGVPFGPYLLGAAALALFIANPVTAWYGSLITT